MASDWQLLTGGRYSEVVIRTGWPVQVKESFKNSLQRSGKRDFLKNVDKTPIKIQKVCPSTKMFTTPGFTKKLAIA
jgi:hypothetical protein